MAKTSKTGADSAMISQRARPEILAMSGYVSARSVEKSNRGTIFLDANECAFEPFIGAQNLSRYPEQQPFELQEAICRWLDVSKRHITITRGADEAIDCLVRTFCVPGQDNIVICPPTFGMYAQSAALQNAEVRQAKLDSKFDLNVKLINQIADNSTKIIFRMRFFKSSKSTNIEQYIIGIIHMLNDAVETWSKADKTLLAICDNAVYMYSMVIRS